jgi:hypothetical protein
VTSFEPSDETKGEIADAALALAEAQLLAQVADDASLDGRTTGLIGFNGALLVATIAVKELLGGLWLVPLFVVGVATLMLLWVLYGGQKRHDRRDDHTEPEPNRGGLAVGVRAGQFYEAYKMGPSLDARERLLGELAIAFDKNFKRIARKRRWLQATTIFLVLGLGVAALLIETDRPTKMRPCQRKAHLSRPACPAQGSTKPERAEDTGELLKLAEGIEGGSAHGVLYGIAEIAEGQQ